MLNRRQRSVLAEIEQQLAKEDPALERVLRGDPGSRLARRLLTDGKYAATIGAVLLVVSLVVEYPTGSVLGLMIAAVGTWRIALDHADRTGTARPTARKTDQKP